MVSVGGDEQLRTCEIGAAYIFITDNINSQNGYSSTKGLAYTVL